MTAFLFLNFDNLIRKPYQLCTTFGWFLKLELIEYQYHLLILLTKGVIYCNNILTILNLFDLMRTESLTGHFVIPSASGAPRPVSGKLFHVM